MRDIINIFEEAGDEQGPVKLYHITSKPKFKLNPNYAPEDNSISIFDRSDNKGIYLTRDVEKWVNGHGYIRPFVAEILADPSVIEDNQIGRWGGEVFVPADQFYKLKVKRVVPLDVIARETYHLHGWIEKCHGHEFDSGNKITAKSWESPFENWTYDKDARNMSPDELKQYKQHFNVGLKNRLKWR